MKNYKDLLLKHYHSPSNYGNLKDYNFSCELENLSCSDKISFQAKIEFNIFKKVAFKGNGCIISQATSSLLSDYILNKDIIFVENISKEDILDLIKIDLGPVRLKCALLPLQALILGIKNFINHDR